MGVAMSDVRLAFGDACVGKKEAIPKLQVYRPLDAHLRYKVVVE